MSTHDAGAPPGDGRARTQRDGGPFLLGVRHHGPGSARAVRAALEQCTPAAVLIEGPPEADALVPLAARDGMRPPVALLAHVQDDPGRAAFWPLAEFSPEWVAMRWALEHGIPVRFIDLPATHTLAMTDETGETEETEESNETNETNETDKADGEGERRGDRDPSGEQDPDQDGVRVDPIRVLAEAAGYDDPERWWEDVVEHRAGTGAAAPGGPETDALAPFAALAEAMGALRETYGDGGHDRDPVREAHMRIQLHTARREFGDSVAVVCGAWHVPALRRRSTVTADRRLLKGLPKVKTAVTWVPWTHRRLARRSGYGAGIASPGWYGHLFSVPDRPVERWLTKVAGLLREEDYAVSSAHVIEAVRLAEGLATVRGRPLAGLTELDDAVRAVMGDGSDAPSALIHDRLVVGEVLGEVPEDAPAVPLQRDLARSQRTLRLKPEALERELELDLRKETDGGRSRLLHRLRLLGVPWGEPVRSRGSTGTFRETWRLRWEPELAVRVAEAGIWGTTVLAAATAKAAAEASGAAALAEVTALAERCLLAGLPDALPVVMRALSDRAALDADVGHLAQALPALVRSVRYGDVRGTDAGALRGVALGLAERVFVGLPPACLGLDADGAAEMRGHLDATHRAVALLAQPQTTPGSHSTPEPSPTPGLHSTPGSHSALEPSTAPEPSTALEPSTAPGSHSAPGSSPTPGSHSTPGARSAPEPSTAPGSHSALEPSPTPGSHSALEPSPTPGSHSALEPSPTPGSHSAPGSSRTPGPSSAPGSRSAPERRSTPESRARTEPPGGEGPGLRARWAGVLRAVSGREAVPGLIRGRAARLLLDDGELGADGAEQLMGLALSPGTPPTDAAAWIEGFLGSGAGGDGGMLLVHDERLLALVDRWLTGVPDSAFTDVLPLLRRTFAEYESGVRRTLGELIRRGPAAPLSGHTGPTGDAVAATAPGFGPGLDRDRAAAVLPTLRLLLGIEQHGFDEERSGEEAAVNDLYGRNDLTGAMS